MWKLTNELEGVTTVAISGHVKPDGDCIGACMGLYHYIKAAYPSIQADVYLEPISDKFSYIEDVQMIQSDCKEEKHHDLFFALDASDKERLGFSVAYFDSAKKTVCIDHHISNLSYADENYIIPDAAATCEIMFDMMEYDIINLSVATALYTGIIHDTGVFRHSNTTEHVMQTAGRLLSKGVHHTDIINTSFFEKTYLQNQILGRALLESIVFYNGTCIFTSLREKQLNFYGVEHYDLEGIIDQLTLTRGIECAIFIYEKEPQVFKVSMRSKKSIDVSIIAEHFGGGGHIHAAGCTITGTEHDVINNISAEIERQNLAMQEHEKQQGVMQNGI